ncbi:hypothetical protein [Bradyrhizobium tunisiense]|uniref:hypothetical protein n=1 Tax=Bradyrhizobium tunisiense TaxID=3278709 RepID=UPI0035DAD057
MEGGLIGVNDGDMIGHIVCGQIGGRSIEFWQMGCILPSTHRLDAVFVVADQEADEIFGKIKAGNFDL